MKFGQIKPTALKLGLTLPDMLKKAKGEKNGDKSDVARCRKQY